MIKINNIGFNQKRISLLCTYKYQYENPEFISIVKKSMENKIDNPTINKGIQKFIKDNKLDSDELFLKQGIITAKDKDLIELKTLDFNNSLYVYGYESIEKATDSKYNGYPAQIYQNKLNRYKRYNADKGVDFELIDIQELGFYVTEPSKNGSVLRNSNKIELLFDDIRISDDNNPMVKEFHDYVNSYLTSKLPKYLMVKGNKLYQYSFDKSGVDYISAILSSNNRFHYNIDDLEIEDETIYFDDIAVIEKVIVSYIHKLLEEKIMSSHEITNIIELVLSLPEIEVGHQMRIENIKSRIVDELNRIPKAKRNYYFALDILDSDTNISHVTEHYKDRTGNIKKLLVQMFGLSHKTKELHIVSKYILMKYNAIEDINKDKKNVVIDTLVKLSVEFGFKLKVIAPARYRSNDFDIIYDDLKNVHGRYAIMIDDEMHAYKLDAELDHYDNLTNGQVKYKDLSTVIMKDIKDLPQTILQKVGIHDGR